MGAVSVFMVGNYLNQPFRDLLCFAWCCCFLLCVYSSNELVEIFFSFAGFNLTSDSSWAWSDVSHLLRCRIWFKNQRILRELASLYCAEVLASLFTLQTMVAMSLTPWVHAGLLKDGEPKVLASEYGGARKKLYRVNEWRHHSQYFRYSRRIFISYNKFWVLSASGETNGRCKRFYEGELLLSTSFTTRISHQMPTWGQPPTDKYIKHTHTTSYT